MREPYVSGEILVYENDSDIFVHQEDGIMERVDLLVVDDSYEIPFETWVRFSDAQLIEPGEVLVKGSAWPLEGEFILSVSDSAEVEELPDFEPEYWM